MSSFLNFLFGICLTALFFLSGYSIYSLRSLEGKFDSLSKSPSEDIEVWYSKNKGSLVANLYFLYEIFYAVLISKWLYISLAYYWSFRDIVSRVRTLEEGKKNFSFKGISGKITEKVVEAEDAGSSPFVDLLGEVRTPVEPATSGEITSFPELPTMATFTSLEDEKPMEDPSLPSAI